MNKHGRSSTIGLIACIGIASAAACGGASGQQRPVSPLGKPFQARATTVCRNVLAQKRAQGPFPFPRFNPTQPNPFELPAIGRFEATTVKIFKRWIHGFRALGRPPSGREPWTHLLGALRRNLRILEDQQAAAIGVDTQTFTSDYYAGNKAQRKVEARSRTLGLPACARASAA